MKTKFIFITIMATFLSACNITLARDVTPPANYVTPTPIATLGALYPINNPNVENGKIIYQAKCAACHGDSGLGDGPQSKQLPVSVMPIGLPEIANPDSPAKWYTTVTQGNIERFMPPFASLSEQEKWDVVTYAFTLHTTPEQIALGKNLFEANCSNCEAQFTNLESMSAISDADLMKQIKESFGNNFSDEELSATASYIRTLTFASESAQIVEPVPTAESTLAVDTTPTAESTLAVDTTPTAESTLAESDQVEVSAEAENIKGQIENRSGESFPKDFTILLRGFQHGADPNAGPQEFLSEEISLDANGNYGFANPITEGQIYFVQFELNGLNYQTAVSVVPAEATELVLPTLVLYETTDDFSALQIESLEIFFDLTNAETAQMFSVYTIKNTSDKTIVIKLENETVPFIAFPKGATGLGFEATQESEIFIPTEDGFAIPPSEKAYGLIAFASIPNERKIRISQPAILDIPSATLLLPEGVKADGDTLLSNGLQPFQDTSFQIYTASGFAKNTSLEFTLSGKPKGISQNANLLENQNIVIGAGFLGIVLIFAGVWLYLKNKNEPDLDDDEIDDSESIMDAIIALDDLHKDGKISDDVYQKRRDELKGKLKHEG
jgi:mono/diheme cytochrome c family protein